MINATTTNTTTYNMTARRLGGGQDRDNAQQTINKHSATWKATATTQKHNNSKTWPRQRRQDNKLRHTYKKAWG